MLEFYISEAILAKWMAFHCVTHVFLLFYLEGRKLRVHLCFLFEKPTGPKRAQVTEYYMKTRRFGTVLNISYICKGFRSMIFHSFSIHKKNMFKKKKVGTLENKTFLSFYVLLSHVTSLVSTHINRPKKIQ